MLLPVQAAYTGVVVVVVVAVVVVVVVVVFVVERILALDAL